MRGPGYLLLMNPGGQNLWIRAVLFMFIISVLDPYSFFPDPDPDPEFDVGDQYGSGSNTDPGL